MFKYTINSTVLTDAPSAPGGPLEAVDVKAETIKLAWRPPADDGIAKVDKYVLEKRPKGKITFDVASY